jgi:hypothetical protein
MSGNLKPPERLNLGETEAGTLRDILAAPSLPVGPTAADTPSERITALREAFDYIGSRRLAANETPADLAAALGNVDQALAESLRWHAELAELLTSLPAGRTRNAVLGDIRRGDLVTWATSVRFWRWQEDRWPSDADPVRRADAEIEVDEFPGLYDAVFVWDQAAGALIAVPTYRAGLTWAPAVASAEAGQTWTVRLAGAAFQLRELIPLDDDAQERLPRQRTA